LFYNFRKIMAKKITPTKRKPVRKRRTYQKNYVRVSGKNWRTGKVSAQFPAWLIVAAIILAVILFTPPDLGAKLSAALMHFFDWLGK